jgi:hypothetical protein
LLFGIIVRVIFGASKYSKIFPHLFSISYFLRLLNIKLVIYKFNNLKFLVKTWVHDDENSIFLVGEEDILPLIEIGDDSIVLDIGAYIGTYSIRLCKKSK